MFSLRKLVLPAALTLVLAACGKDEAPPAATPAATTASTAPAAPAAAAATTPVASVNATSAALKSGDLKAMAKAVLPPTYLAKAKAKFEENMAKEEITDEKRKEFADGLAKIAGPGAVDALMAQIEPQLEAMKPQMSAMITMGLGAAQMQIPENKDLTESQKAQALAVLNGVQGWAMQTDFADAGKLRAALTHVSEAVSATGITTLDQVHALKFEEALDKGSIVFVGLKKALNEYGLNLDEMADTMKSEVVSETGDVAKVKSTFSLFGTEIVSESELVKREGGWYGKDLIAKMDEAEGTDGGTPAQ
jgi:hypothetical protein